MTPFPYRAEDVHLTLRPTHQTREPLGAPSSVAASLRPDGAALISETHEPRYQVGQVGYVAEPWGYNYLLDESDEQPAETMPASLSATFQRCERVRVERLWWITEDDIKEHGLPLRSWASMPELPPTAGFAKRWDFLHAGTGRAWGDNPFVFVYHWKQITREEAEAGV